MAAEVLRRAGEVDDDEDRRYGKDKRGDELPEELAFRESRLRKIREAKEALEAEALAEAEQARNHPDRIPFPGRRQRQCGRRSRCRPHRELSPGPAVAMAHNLARWTARIGLGEQIVTTKTLRRRVFALVGRITRSARRLTLHLPRRWPWEEQFSRALARLRAIPLPT